MKNPFDARLAVCSWSLQPKDPDALLAALAKTGVRRIQLALDPLRESPSVWGEFPKMCSRHGVEIVSGMFGTVGEDYSTLESIRRTGGVVPDGTWDENWRNLQVTARIAGELGLKLVTFHAGFIPHDMAGRDFAKISERIARMADLFARDGIDLALETGQETAETLGEFLRKLDKATVGVNFDPANLILYDRGDPVAALGGLAPWLKQCHIKDAVKTNVPGAWGREVPVGKGEVDWRAFLRTLEQLNFRGDLVIEREAGELRVADVRSAREFLLRVNAAAP